MKEKERLLAVASPEEWDWWLSAQSGYFIDNDFHLRCLFCEAVGAFRGCVGNGKPHDCGQCMPDGYKQRFVPCCKYDDLGDKLDAAIARLEAAGIWEDEKEKLTRRPSKARKKKIDAHTVEGNCK